VQNVDLFDIVVRRCIRYSHNGLVFTHSLRSGYIFYRKTDAYPHYLSSRKFTVQKTQKKHFLST